MELRRANTTKRLGIPEKERIWVFTAVGMTVLILIVGIGGMLHMSAASLHSRSFEHTYKNYGSNARLALFFVLAYYVLSLLIKQRIWGRMEIMKKGVVILLRIVRKWHTPAAILAIGLIVLHAAAVFVYGFTFNFSNVSGLLALIVLLPVPVSGLFRYKRLDRRWHLRSGLAFAVLFLIHAFL
ncbi:hypothetical protein GK047_02900 [Paenibacillus sp. SYP-B3998]|uniref:Ferric oxidoreductase domain-containing protein n=1 Tax=Paenibacillus sp. SYP-B3998 TaxID=2678564 RepID=A0A6G3ZRX9_9BACL|nr:hypothetical protein [Paenibacillus sp. SYP-B3998]NEW04966.1 hypothetical protein [Paenibacillus sp. SYP-B3998]